MFTVWVIHHQSCTIQEREYDLLDSGFNIWYSARLITSPIAVNYMPFINATVLTLINHALYFSIEYTIFLGYSKVEQHQYDPKSK